MFQENFAELASRITAGDIDHEFVADMMMNGAKYGGVTISREAVLADLHKRLPTVEELLAYTRHMLASYIEAASPPHNPSDLPH